MPIVSIDIVRKRLQESKCIRTSRPLVHGESCFSRNGFPGLYDGKVTPPERNFTLEIIKVVQNNAPAIRSWSQVEREALQKSFHLLLRSSESIGEIVLHVYLYLFWQQITSSAPLHSVHGRCFYLGGGNVQEHDLPTSGRTEYRKFLSELASEARVDLVAIDESREIAFLIDVKRSALDDRAIGQMLRYYQTAANLIYKGKRVLNISHVRPVIFQSSDDITAARNWPLHFKEIVALYNYKINPDGELQFNDLRRRFISAGFMM